MFTLWSGIPINRQLWFYFIQLHTLSKYWFVKQSSGWVLKMYGVRVVCLVRRLTWVIFNCRNEIPKCVMWTWKYCDSCGYVSVGLRVFHKPIDQQSMRDNFSCFRLICGLRHGVNKNHMSFWNLIIDDPLRPVWWMRAFDRNSENNHCYGTIFIGYDPTITDQWLTVPQRSHGLGSLLEETVPIYLIPLKRTWNNCSSLNIFTTNILNLNVRWPTTVTAKGSLFTWEHNVTHGKTKTTECKE